MYNREKLGGGGGGGAKKKKNTYGRDYLLGVFLLSLLLSRDPRRHDRVFTLRSGNRDMVVRYAPPALPLQTHHLHGRKSVILSTVQQSKTTLPASVPKNVNLE